MNTNRVTKLLVFILGLGLSFSTFQALSEDIDLFTVDEGDNVAHPNVLIILDNSANWSQNAQHWQDDPTQGASEVRAIKEVINGLDENINVGLMEYETIGNGSTAGFIRYHIRPMTPANKANLSTVLDFIYGRATAAAEKANSSFGYGALFWDAYNYLSGGDQSNAGAKTDTFADSGGYDTLYSNFHSPLTALDTCTQTTIILIANNTSQPPTADNTPVVNALSNLGGVTTPQIKWRNFNCTASTTITDLGYSSSCYASEASCDTAENGATCTANGYTSCDCSSSPAAPIPCAVQNHFTATGVTTSTTTTTHSGPTTVGPTSGQSTGDIVQTCKTTGQANALNPTSCPLNSDITTVDDPPGFSPVRSTRRQTSWTAGSCSYVNIGNTGCSGSKNNYEKRGTKTVITTVTSQTTTNNPPVALPGETTACYADQASCSTTSFAGCPGGPPGSPTYVSCACDAPGSTTNCSATDNKFKVSGQATTTSCTAGNTFFTPPTQGGDEFMSDEWSLFLSQTGVLLPGGARAPVKTHTIDVFKDVENSYMHSLLFSIARVSGGEYYQAKNRNDIRAALTAIFAQVQAVNSAFASATLPINATNRTQNENQVFLGLFKPGRTKQPLWFGNLKKFKLIVSGNDIKLGDENDNPAVDDATGFLDECAESFWTTDTGQYWFFTREDDPDARGTCASTASDVHSDLPDGPFAEKGGAAEVLRKGNTTGTVDADGNYALTRNIKTLSGGSLVNFSGTIAGLDDFVTKFARGEDTENEDLDTGARYLTEPRSTIHGDVIHSRPLAITYPSPNGVVVYYGANDGVYHAVKSDTGQELWSFAAPEHYSKYQRLKDNTPLVKYFGDTAPGLVRRDYFFDGSTGLYQNSDNTDIRIFTTMRRGGRKIHSFNVTTPTTPSYVWGKGCPNLADDTGCDNDANGDFRGIGQTWSIPNAAFLKNYPAVGAQTPVIIMGGGYDSCEDADTAAPTCTNAKGRVIYVLNALTGAIVRSFDLSSVTGTRSIAADMALIDMNNDSFVDHAYAVDLGGNFYRVDLKDSTPLTAATPSEWTVQRIAYTNGDGRKFLFAPALVQATDDIVYLAIGSGDREAPLAAQYPYTTNAPNGVINRMYVFKDNVTTVADPTLSVALTSGFDLDGSSMIDHTDSDGVCSDQKVLPSSAEKGWFIDLTANGRGEQTVTSAVIATGFVFLSTNRPTPDAVTTACSNSLGQARGYFMNLLNAAGSIGIGGTCATTPGTAFRSAIFTGGGLPPSPVLATVPVGGKVRTVIIGGIAKHATDAQGNPYGPGNPFDPDDEDNSSSPFNPPEVTPIIRPTRTPIYWFKSTGDN